MKFSLKQLLAACVLVSFGVSFGSDWISLVIQNVSAGFTQNDSDGFYEVDFNGNEQGLDPGTNVNLSVNPAGYIGLSGGANGSILSSEIRPTSFTTWNDIRVDTLTYANAGDVQVDVYDCAVTPVAIGAFGGPQNLGAGGIVPLVSLNGGTPPECIRVQLRLNQTSGPAPTVDNLRVTWEPLPVFLIGLSASDEKPVGDIVAYRVSYSISFAESKQTVVWVDVNATGNTVSYGQTVDPIFVEASHGGGQCTTNPSCAINGVTVPENAIYFDLGDVDSGTSGTLAFRVKSENGLENGIQYRGVAHIDNAGNADQADSPMTTTTLTSSPYPSIDKKVGGIITMKGNNHVYDDGVNYTPSVTYSVEVTNNAQYFGKGHETIFNPQIVDDLSDIDTKLETFCGVGDGMDRVTNIGSGGAKVGNTIVWDSSDLTDMAPGGSQVVTYDVDYTGCPDDISRTYDNTATLSADNITNISDPASLVIGIDVTPSGIFAKGDRVFGDLEVSALSDDNKDDVQPHEDLFSYIVRAANSGVVRLDDVVAVDELPSEVSLVSASAPVGTLYYSDAVSQPTVTVTSNKTGSGGIDTSGGWSTTPPVNTKWIVWYVPCLNSAFFPSTECSYGGQTGPSLIDLEMQVKLNTPPNSCAQYDATNTVRYEVYSAATTVTNNNADIDDTASHIGVGGAGSGTPLLTATETEDTHVEPPLGDLSVDSSVVGPDEIQIGQSGTYVMTVKNTGADAVENVSVRIPLPQVSVNGVENQPLTFVNASGGTVDTSGLPNEVSVNVGTLPTGSEKTINLVLSVPKGVLDGEAFTLTGIVTGTDDDNCQEIGATLEKQTTARGVPDLKIIKSRDEAIVPTANDIHYKIDYFNTGQVATTGTYIIDYIPEKTVFKQAYTSGQDATVTTFTCGGCKVYFSQSVPTLPAGPSPTTPLSASHIGSSFTLGTEVSPGVWDSPFGTGTRWVAWLIDSPGLTPPQVPTGSDGIGNVGLTLTNDDDGYGPGTAGSVSGTIISNASAVFADNLLQAIAAPVFTTILPDPGLFVSKYTDSEDEVIYAGEDFKWKIDFTNNSGNIDTLVTLSDTLPYGVQLAGQSVGPYPANTITINWNDKAENAPTNAPNGIIDITNHANTVITNNPDRTTTIDIDIIALLGSNLLDTEGGTIELDVTALSTLNSGTSIQNEVCSTFDNPSTGGNPKSACTQHTVNVFNPDLYIRKQADIADPLPNEEVTYTVIVSNEGINGAPNVLLRDTLPLDVCYVPGSTNVLTTGWSLPEPSVTGTCGSGQTLIWNGSIDGTGSGNTSTIGEIPVNSEDIYITYKVLVDGSVGQGVALINGAHVQTSITEDVNYTNDASSTITTSIPDPRVTKSVVPSVIPGQTFAYNIAYSNTERTDALNSYIIDTLPDLTGGGDSDGAEITILSVSDSEALGTVYYHAYSAARPAFTSGVGGGSWTTDAGSLGNNIHYIAVDFGTLPAQTTGNITITAQVTDPLPTPTNLNAGLALTNTVDIFADVDGDIGNNTSSAITQTPGFDLVVKKTASKEGIYPGALPGDTLVYTVEFSNEGTERACAVYVEDVLPSNVTLVAPEHNFNLLKLTNGVGEDITPTALATGTPISEPIIPSYTYTAGTRTMRWNLGDTNNPYTSVCIPAGSKGSFDVFAQIDLTAADGDTVLNTAQVGEDDGIVDNEDVLSNNTDTTSVTVYRADVYVEKTGTSSDEDSDTDNDTNTTEVGDTITYEIEYGNIGNADAQDVIISEVIPQGTCFKVGSVSAIEGATLQFSEDSGVSWNYTPVADAENKDCNVTNFRYVLGSALPAGNAWQQSCAERPDYLQFNESSTGYVRTPLLSYDTDETYSLWVYMDNDISNTLQVDFWDTQEAGRFERTLFLQNFYAGSVFSYSWQSPHPSGQWPNYNPRISNFRNIGTKGRWVHIVNTITPTTSALYMDGSLVQELPTFGTPTRGVATFDLGTRLKGRLRDFAKFDRTFTAAEVSDLYANGVNVNDSDLQGYWPLDEGNGQVVQDKSGKGHHAVIIGDPTWKTENCDFEMEGSLVDSLITYEAVKEIPFGYSDQFCPASFTEMRLDFDGVDDYVSLGNSIDVQDDNFFSGWVKLDNFSQSGTIIAGANHGANNNAGWGMYMSAGTLKIAFKASGSFWLGDVPVSSVLSLNTWGHVAFYYPGDGSTPRMWVNGVEQTLNVVLNTGGLNGVDQGNDLRIGNSNRFFCSSCNRPFHGGLRDFALYDGLPTNAVITSLAGDNPPDLLDPNLIGYWPLDEGSGIPQDSSSNNNHAVSNSAQWRHTCPYLDQPEDKGGKVVLAYKENIVHGQTKISDTEGGLIETLDDGDQFGGGVASLGDLDGDGVGDIAVVAYGDDDGGSGKGAVYILFLNADGTVKSEQKISDTEGGLTESLDNGDGFGIGVASLGDLDGDGVGDIVVGANGDDDGGSASGALYVLFLNEDGTIKDEQKISNLQGGLVQTLPAGGGFGVNIAFLGDVDGDGVVDIGVGAHTDPDSGFRHGAVYVLFLNTDGTVKDEQKISGVEGGFSGPIGTTEQRFGIGVGGVGDIDGDGVGDMIVGATYYNGTNGGMFLLFLNPDGTVKYQQEISKVHPAGAQFVGSTNGGQLGRDIVSLGDLDGNGVNDILVGEFFGDDGASNSGAAFVLLLDKDGTVKDTQKISNTSGGLSIPLDATDLFGASVASLGDLDGDGIGTIVVGAINDDDGGTNNGGAVHVLDLGLFVYEPNGTYTTNVGTPTGTLQSWKRLLVDQILPEGTNITYSVGRQNGGSCDVSAFPGLVNTSAPNGFIDVSSISSSETSLCIVSTLSTTNSLVTPELRSLTMTYSSDAKRTFTFDVLVVDAELYSQQVVNNVTIETSTPESDTSNNQDDHVFTVEAADVSILKSVDKGAVSVAEIGAGSPSNQITYTLTYENNGPNEAENVVIKDVLPRPDDYTGTVSVVVTHDGSTPSPQNNAGGNINFVCNQQDLDAGLAGAETLVCSENGTDTNGVDLPVLSKGVITVTVTLDPAATWTTGDLLLNNVEIETTTLDLNKDNNTDAASTLIDSVANLIIEKRGPTQAHVNGFVTYELEYTNTGNAPANNVVITDNYNPIAGDLNEFVNPQSSVGMPMFDTTGSPHFTDPMCRDVSHGIAECGNGDGVTLNPGDAGVITVRLRVDNNLTLLADNESIENHVDISTSSPESNLSDNHDEAVALMWPVGFSSISGTVFEDDGDFDLSGTNAINGTQELGEDPIHNVTMFLGGTDIYGNVFGPSKDDYPQAYEVMMDELVATGQIPAGAYNAGDAYPANYLIQDPTSTDANGDYGFAGLAPGTYTVLETQPTGYASTGSSGGTGANTNGDGSFDNGAISENVIRGIALGEAQNSINNNFGETKGWIGTHVWKDNDATEAVDAGTDYDGVYQDGVDTPLAGVELTLYLDANTDGTPDPTEIVGVTTTGTDGRYQFVDLDVDNKQYIVVVTDSNDTLKNQRLANITGLAPSTANHDSKDATGYSVTLNSTVATSHTDVRDITADFGYINGFIGNQVFDDRDGNAVWDGGAGSGGVDVPIEDVEITIYEDDGDGIKEIGGDDEVVDRDLNTVGVQPYAVTTDTNGEYQFVGLDPSKSYWVAVTDGTTLGTPSVVGALYIGETSIFVTGGPDNLTKRNDGYRVDLTSDLTDYQNTFADFGYIKLDGVVGDTVFEDVNANGIYENGIDIPIDTVVVEAYRDDGTIPGAYDAGDTLLGTETTGTSQVSGCVLCPLGPLPGQYWFGADDGVVTAVGGADYILRIAPSNLVASAVLDPVDWIHLTYEDVHGSTMGANNNSKTQQGYGVTITTSAVDQDRVDLTGDFGYIRRNGEVGGIIFDDVNTNGTYDVATDTAIDDVAVTVYQDSNGNGTLEVGTDTLIGTQDSGSGANPTGEYLFTKLDPRGTYFTVVDTSDPQLLAHFGTTGVGHTVGATPGADNNSQQNDEVSEGGYVRTLSATPTLSDRQDYTGDFGYTGKGKIGNFTYVDNDLDGGFSAGDTPLSGIVLELFEDDGDGVQETDGGDDTSLGTQTTNGAGSYLFDNLDPTKQYWVVVKTLNSSYPYRGPVGTVGINDQTQRHEGYFVDLPTKAGFEDLTADFGFTDQLGRIGNIVFRDENKNGTFDTGDFGIAGVEVVLYQDNNANGVADGGEPELGRVFTDANGEYAFENLNPLGDYVVLLNRTYGSPLDNSKLSVSTGPQGSRNDNDSKNMRGYGISLSFVAGDPTSYDNQTGDFGFIYNTRGGGGPSIFTPDPIPPTPPVVDPVPESEIPETTHPSAPKDPDPTPKDPYQEYIEDLRDNSDPEVFYAPFNRKNDDLERVTVFPKTGLISPQLQKVYDAESLFVDVDVNHPYYTATVHLYLQGIIDKGKDGTMGINYGITKQELYQLLYVALGKNIIKTDQVQEQALFEDILFSSVQTEKLATPAELQLKSNWQDLYLRSMLIRNLLPEYFYDFSDWGNHFLTKGEVYDIVYRLIQRQDSKEDVYNEVMKVTIPGVVTDLPTHRTLLSQPSVWLSDLTEGAAFYEDLRGEESRYIVFAHSSAWSWDNNPFGWIFRPLLWKLFPQENISITQQDGTTLEYVITSRTRVSEDDIGVLKQQTKEADLVIFTCGEDTRYRWVFEAKRIER